MSTPFPKVPTRLALPKNLPTDLPSALEYIQVLTTELQSYVNQMAIYTNNANGADVAANRPSAGYQGRTYWATDTLHFYVDDGSSWIQVV